MSRMTFRIGLPLGKRTIPDGFKITVIERRLL